MTYKRFDMLAGYWEKPWADLSVEEQWAWFAATPSAHLSRTPINMTEGLPVPDDGRWDMNTVEMRKRIAMEYDEQHDPVLKVIGGYDGIHSMNAAMWFKRANIKPDEAAMLLWRLNPLQRDWRGNAPDPENTYVEDDKTSPAHYRALKRAFEDVAENDPKPRTLLDWLCVAMREGLAYHDWIEDYTNALYEIGAIVAESDAPQKVGGGDTAQGTEEESRPTAEVATKPCADFLAMQKLTASEVVIEFAAGESGGVILNVSARGVTRRIALAELDLIDRRTGDMNTQGVLLLGLAQGKHVRTAGPETSKQIERLRNALKSTLGITDKPIAHQGNSGYLPVFQITDSRGAADLRAKREAERSMVSLDELQGSGVQFGGNENAECNYESEGDDAGEWLKKNAG